MLNNIRVIDSNHNQTLWYFIVVTKSSHHDKSLHVISGLILKMISWDKYFYYIHFTDKKKMAQRLKNVLKVTQLEIPI